MFVSFNRRFLNGHNFLPWFQRKCAVAELEQNRLWRQARLRTDIQNFISEMSELEIVDSFNSIERHLLGELQVISPIILLVITNHMHRFKMMVCPFHVTYIMAANWVFFGIFAPLTMALDLKECKNLR